MSRFRTRFMLSTTAAVALLGGGSGYAQENEASLASDGDLVIEEIIVTATKRATTLQDTPLSVSVFGSDYLEQNSVRELTDFVDSIPNVRLPDSLNAGNIGIRGISSQAHAGAAIEQPVSVYLDEVFVDSMFLGSFILDIASIEVIRGPQGTVWGRNTAAGAVTYTTGRPTSETEGYVEIDYGNYDLLTMRGAVSGPLMGDKVKFRLAYGHWERDGYEKRTSGGTFGAENTDSFRGQLEFTPTDNSNLLLIGSYSESDFSPRSQVYAAGPFVVGGAGSREADTNDRGFARGEIQRHGITAIANYEFAGYTLTSVTGYNKRDFYATFDEDGTTNDWVISFFNTPDNPQETEQFSQELRLASPEGKVLDYTLGLYYFDRTDSQLITTSFSDFLAPMITEIPIATAFENDVAIDQATEAYAAFGQANWHVTDQLTAMVGFRQNRETKNFAANQDGIRIFTADGLLFGMPGGDLVELEPFKDTNTTFTGGLTYEWNDDVTTYFTFAQGYKSGGFNGDSVTNPAVNPFFGSEDATQYELGLRSTFLDDQVVFNATAFWLEYDHLQIEEFVPSAVALADIQVGNAGKARSRGIEIEAMARLAPGWDLGLAFGYLDAEFTDFSLVTPDGTVIFDRDGNKLPFAPKFNWSLSSRYEFALADFARAFVGGEWVFSDSYFQEPNNAAAGEQSSYSTFNARVGIISGDGTWEFAIWGRNLTNEDISVDYNDQLPPFFGDSVFETLTAPRTFGAELRYRF